MSKHDGNYVKVQGNDTLWVVDNGKRTAVKNAEEMYSIGLRPVDVISTSALSDIPLAGSVKKGGKKS